MPAPNREPTPSWSSVFALGRSLNFLTPGFCSQCRGPLLNLASQVQCARCGQVTRFGQPRVR